MSLEFTEVVILRMYLLFNAYQCSWECLIYVVSVYVTVFRNLYPT